MTLSIVSAMSTGTILTIIRIQEPYFKFLMISKFKQCFGILHEASTDDQINDSLASFINSSLNIELVHVILSSIT